jgi:hypothetical protein
LRIAPTERWMWPMDDRQYQELIDKRDTEGLSDEEANELGRMMAQKEGKPYHSALQEQQHDEVPEVWTAEEKAKEQEESSEAVKVRGTDPQKQRALGDEREPVGPAPGGYVPPKGGREATFPPRVAGRPARRNPPPSRVQSLPCTTLDLRHDLSWRPARRHPEWR